MLMDFNSYVRTQKVKKVSPDPSEAKGLIKTSIEDFKNIKKSFKVDGGSASLVFKNVYDCIRGFLQSFLAADGWNPYSHEAIIAFNMGKKNITNKEANQLDRFRELRNDIVYRAARATPEEAKEIIEFAETLFKRLKS